MSMQYRSSETIPSIPRICPSIRLRRASSWCLLAVEPLAGVCVFSIAGILSSPYPYPLGVPATVDRVGVIDVIWHGLRDSFLMAWEVWWALVLGFAISAIVQAWVPRKRIKELMSGSGPRPIAWSTGLGAA